MKKLALIILVFLLIVFFCPSAASAEYEEYELKYDFHYLVQWIASKVEITIDQKKPLPKLRILPQQKVQRLYEEFRNGKSDSGVAGFYDYFENIIYVKDKVDPNKDETLEETIIHELIHYYQHHYPSFFSQDFTCLENFFPYRGCPRQREACKWEKLFRLKHGLMIIDSDLECLTNPQK